MSAATCDFATCTADEALAFFSTTKGIAVLKKYGQRNELEIEEVRNALYLLFATTTRRTSRAIVDALRNAAGRPTRGRAMTMLAADLPRACDENGDTDSDMDWAEGETIDSPESLIEMRETMALLESEGSADDWLAELDEIEAKDVKKSWKCELLAKHHAKGQRIANRVWRGAWR